MVSAGECVAGLDFRKCDPMWLILGSVCAGGLSNHEPFSASSEGRVKCHVTV